MSEAYAVIYSSEALDDLSKIYSYIAYELGVPSTALRQVSRIKKEIRSLDFMPMRYSLVHWEPWQSMKMHKVPVDNYVIYYTVDTGSCTVTVIRIFYEGQDVAGIINSNND